MTVSTASRTADHSAARLVLRGHVQGIGVRPAVARLAGMLRLAGRVGNQTGGVEIHIEGTAADVAAFQQRLPAILPPAAVVEQLESAPAPLLHVTGFRIEVGSAGGPLATRVPRDRGVCDRCLREFALGGDRRYGYAFTSCTDCGPRYSVIEAMPYERTATSMREFPLCEACDAEFTSPDDRRFHAQTNACRRCGPSLWGEVPGQPADVRGCAALAAAASRLKEGKLIALKAIGGYQLICDATSRDAVQTLRFVKQRPSKPLAVMVAERNLELLPEREQSVFECAANPIVIVPAASIPAITEELAPGLDTAGVMRPTSPLHASLLQRTGRPLVVTSGNTAGRPLAFQTAGANEDLKPHVDLLLHHDRRIVRAIDDSVVRVIADRAVTIRCGRGLAPLPLELPAGSPMLAVGGHQKVAVAICNGQQCVLGPHIGDLDSIPLRERFVTQTRDLLQLYQAEPELIVHDMHPDYFTTRWAQEQNRPTFAVQHHHAHVVAGMLEHHWLDRPVLGVAFDGTGWGPDGTIWGGEFLQVTARSFQRVGSLLPFLLPGGEQAIRQPWRVALALLSAACGVDEAVRVVKRRIAPVSVEPVVNVVTRGFGPRTSSVGRLFDSVAALILGLRDSSWEGEPAMRLEAACERTADGEYSLPVRDDAPVAQLDWRPLLQELSEDLACDTAAGVIAMRFHRAMAAGVVQMAGHYAELPVVLGGGCFQNRILTELVAECLSERSQPVGLPGVIPPNDGGLAAGQLAIAQARYRHALRNPDRIATSCV